MKKRIISILLVMVMLISMIPMTALAATSPFSDVSTKNWAYSSVMYCYERNICNGMGNGKFAPNATLTAAQFFTMLDKIVLSVDLYEDVPQAGDKWWSTYYRVADKNGLFNGTDVNLANFNKEISRYDMAQVVYNVLHVAMEVKGKVAKPADITDYDTIPARYKDAVQWCYGSGIFTGDASHKYNGNDFVTRAQSTVAMMKLNKIVLDSASIAWEYYTDLSLDGVKEPNPENRMAFNIYADHQFGDVKKFSGFLIDFRADYAPEATYWALCNWSMDTSCLPSNAHGGGAYAGLQHRDIGRDREWAYIMSFWNIEYSDASGNHLLTAKMIYPTGNTALFEGEGEGAQRVGEYLWKPGQWYRMYLNCYDDANGHTIVEQWFEDLSTGEWTKTVAFDTGLTHSYLKGNMSQFMENYLNSACDKTRTCEYKNVYVRDYATGKWQAATNTRLSIDAYKGGAGGDKKGSFAFDATETTLFGVTNGHGPSTITYNPSTGKYSLPYEGWFKITPTADPETPN